MSESTEDLFNKALEVATRYLEAAMAENAELRPYVAVAMIGAAVDVAVEETGHDDVIEMLRDIAQQVEDDEGDEEDQE